MSILSRVTNGKVKQPFYGVIFGPDAVGKTTLAADSGKTLLIDLESGSRFINVNRIEGVTTLDEIYSVVNELLSTAHDYKTLAIDSLDQLEPLVWSTALTEMGDMSKYPEYKGRKFLHIEDVPYMKGYENSVDVWDSLLRKLRELQTKRAMNVILIGHTMMKTHSDPITNASYDRYILKMHHKAASKIRELVDYVLFMNFETLTSTDEKTHKTKAFGDGTRHIYTERRPAHDAKSRESLPYDIVLPLNSPWNTLMKHIEDAQSDEKASAIRDNISSLIAQLTDKELVEKVNSSVAKAGENTELLRAIKNRLITVLAA
jgi:hypothetical protein